jgi:uncharacterized membrane protein YphA (DoxX/SURF4 family)
MQLFTNLVAAEFAVAVRTALALVFLSAALGKMRHWTEFQGVIANYRLLPERLIAPVAYLLPPAETLLAVLLAVGLAAAWACAAAAVLLLVFAVAMSINVRRGRRFIDCGCFQSALKQTLSWRLVGRNLGLAALAMGAALVPPERGLAWETLDAMIAGATLFVLLQALNLLWSIVPAWSRTAGAGGRP